MAPAVPQTLLFFDSLPGDFVGMGQRNVLSAANSIWTASAWESGGVRFVIVGSLVPQETPGSASRFGASPVGRLAAGLELPVTMEPGPRSRRRVHLRGQPSACRHPSAERSGYRRRSSPPMAPHCGWLADIEQHSRDDLPGLFVALRYNSRVDTRSRSSARIPTTRSPRSARPENGRVIRTGGARLRHRRRDLPHRLEEHDGRDVVRRGRRRLRVRGWTGSRHDLGR